MRSFNKKIDRKNLNFGNKSYKYASYKYAFYFFDFTLSNIIFHSLLDSDWLKTVPINP